MTSSPDEHARPWLGAYAIGHLDAERQAWVRDHLDRCAECRREAGELERVAAVLPLVDPDRIVAGAEPAPPIELLDEVFDRIHRESREHGRAARRTVVRRTAAVAAAIAALLVGVTLGIDPGPGAPAPQVVSMHAARRGVVGEAVIHDDPQSTWVELTAAGLSPGETYAVWFEDSTTGDRAPLGTFLGVGGDLYISLYSTLARDRAIAIGVSDQAGDTVMEGAVPPVPG
jgi:anti-sigma-K factor RskA